jgi:hypothetical protein
MLLDDCAEALTPVGVFGVTPESPPPSGHPVNKPIVNISITPSIPESNSLRFITVLLNIKSHKRIEAPHNTWHTNNAFKTLQSRTFRQELIGFEGRSFYNNRLCRLVLPGI